MLQPVTYERGIYGDLMLAGIACGVRKFLLIFNTNLDVPTNPIYVVDPRTFNVMPDSDIPIVLAYNLSHYESMHPCTNDDALSTKHLVNDFLAERTKFQRKDMEYLLTNPALLKPNRSFNQNEGNGSTKPYSPVQKVKKKVKIDKLTEKGTVINEQILFNKDIPILKLSKENKQTTSKEKSRLEVEAGICKEENITADNIMQDNQSKKSQRGQKVIQSSYQSTISNFKEIRKQSKKLLGDPKNKEGKEIPPANKNSQVNTLTYYLKGTMLQSTIQIVSDKMECPFCQVLVKNIKVHFSRAAKCGSQIDLNSFIETFDTYQKEKTKERKRRNHLVQKQRDTEEFKRKNNEAVKIYNEKSKIENREKFNQNNLRAVIKHKEKSKADDKERFDLNHLTAVKKKSGKVKS